MASARDGPSNERVSIRMNVKTPSAGVDILQCTSLPCTYTVAICLPIVWRSDPIPKLFREKKKNFRPSQCGGFWFTWIRRWIEAVSSSCPVVIPVYELGKLFVSCIGKVKTKISLPCGNHAQASRGESCKRTWPFSSRSLPSPNRYCWQEVIASSWCSRTKKDSATQNVTQKERETVRFPQDRWSPMRWHICFPIVIDIT